MSDRLARREHGTPVRARELLSGDHFLGLVCVGKTMLAQPLGRAAIETSFLVRFKSAAALFFTLQTCRLDDTPRDETRRLCRVNQLIIDDFA